jgi:hypothetical protein
MEPPTFTSISLRSSFVQAGRLHSANTAKTTANMKFFIGQSPPCIITKTTDSASPFLYHNVKIYLHRRENSHSASKNARKNPRMG